MDSGRIQFVFHNTNGFRKMSTALVSMLQKMETGYRIQDSGLFSRTRNDSAKLIQLEMIQLNGFSSNYSGFRGKWIQRRSGE